MSDVLSDLRHELRTHLNHVLGYSELLLEGIDGPDQELLDRPLREVRSSATEALAGLDQLLSDLSAGDDPAVARATLDQTFERVSRHVAVLSERATKSGDEAVLLDVLRIDFAARHASALVGHPLLAARLLGGVASTGESVREERARGRTVAHVGKRRRHPDRRCPAPSWWSTTTRPTATSCPGASRATVGGETWTT